MLLCTFKTENQLGRGNLKGWVGVGGLSIKYLEGPSFIVSGPLRLKTIAFSLGITKQTGIITTNRGPYFFFFYFIGGAIYLSEDVCTEL